MFSKNSYFHYILLDITVKVWLSAAVLLQFKASRVSVYKVTCMFEPQRVISQVSRHSTVPGFHLYIGYITHNREQHPGCYFRQPKAKIISQPLDLSVCQSFLYPSFCFLHLSNTAPPPPPPPPALSSGHRDEQQVTLLIEAIIST